MKERQKGFFDSLLDRKALFIILLFVVFLLFREIFWKAYNETIVDEVLIKIHSHWLNDAMFFLLIIFTIVSTAYLIRNEKRISNSYFFTFFILFLLFFYCRFFSGTYTFKPYYFFPSLKYIDYLLLLFSCVVLVKILNWSNIYKDPVYQTSPFLVDKPIKIADDDKFSRKIFAKKIAEKIQSKLKVEKAGALAIGINGVWGSGKTSFANMIVESINRKNRIIIDFNPWRSSSSGKIIEDFFELLITEIKPYDPSLSNKIADYAKTLTKIEENVLTKSAEAIAGLLFEEKSKNEVYDSINNSIEKIKKQIVIFIDDLDRLDKKEIIEVLRIIRNTANFNNVVYVVSYDKGYIQTAIKDFNEYNYRSFLEKIFQFEFTLPMYENGVLRTEMKQLLKGTLGEKLYTQIDRVVDSKEYYRINFTNEIVKTYRDVVRFVNSLLFEIETIQEEVFFYDFYLLQLLKLEYPKVYEALVDNQYTFFKIDGEKGLYRLKTETEVWTSDDVLSFSKSLKNDSRDEPNNDEKKQISSFEKYLEDNSGSLALNIYDKKLLLYLVNTLLTLKVSKNVAHPFSSSKEPKYQEQDVQLYKSFAYPVNFHKYFSFKLYEGDISAKDFEDYRRREFSEYKLKALQWIEQGKYSVLIDRLEKIEDFITVEEFENHILVLLEIGRYQLKENITNPYWMDYTLILKNFQYPVRRQGDVRLYTTIDDYRKFLLKTFKNSPKPPVYESYIVARLIAERINVGFSMDELSKINFIYFKDYCNTHQEVTQEFRQLHSNAVRPIEDYNEKYEVIPEAQKLFVTYFLINLRGSGLAGFIRHTHSGTDYFHIDYDWIKTFFLEPVWENFEIYLQSNGNIKVEKEHHDEFMNFYTLFKENNYKPVEFIFQYLQPSLWTGGTKTNPIRK